MSETVIKKDPSFQASLLNVKHLPGCEISDEFNYNPLRSLHHSSALKTQTQMCTPSQPIALNMNRLRRLTQTLGTERQEVQIN